MEDTEEGWYDAVRLGQRTTKQFSSNVFQQKGMNIPNHISFSTIGEARACCTRAKEIGENMHKSIYHRCCRNGSSVETILVLRGSSTF